MKPDFLIKRKFGNPWHCVHGIEGEYKIIGTWYKDENPFYTLAATDIGKNVARQFSTSVDKVLNFFDEKKGGGGGFVKVSPWNDGKKEFWADLTGEYFITLDTEGMIHIPGGMFSAAMLRRIKKLVGEAVDTPVKRDPFVLRFKRFLKSGQI